MSNLMIKNDGKMMITEGVKLQVSIQALSEFYWILYEMRQQSVMQLVTLIFTQNGLSITVPNMTVKQWSVGFGDKFLVGYDDFITQINCKEEIRFKLALPELDCLMYYGLKSDNMMNIMMLENSDDMIISFPTIHETHIIYAR